MVSASSAYVTGSMPPAAAPITKHMPTFHHNEGIAPQIAVPTNITADNRIDARRPYTSASQPHTTEPTTVPHNAANGSHATVVFGTAYSAVIPGSTKPRLAGFITSITSATVSTIIKRQCAGPSGASSGADTVEATPAAEVLTWGSRP